MSQQVRCSSLPLAMSCPQSLAITPYRIAEDGPSAALGSAVHLYLSSHIKGAAEELSELAHFYGVSLSELEPLAYKSLSLWKQVAKYFPNPEVEKPFTVHGTGLTLHGTRDVVAYNPASKTVFVCDHKSGWVDADCSEQLMGYAFGSISEFIEAERVHLIVTRIREYVTDHATYERQEVLAWSDRMFRRLVSEGDAYAPGKHCGHCPRWHSCPAFKDYTSGAIELILENSTGGITLTPENPNARFRRTYEAVKVVEKLCERARDVLKAHAVAGGGRLEFDNGYELQLVHQVRQEITYQESLPILINRIPADLLPGCFSVKKTAVQDAIKSTAGRGQKGQVVADLMAELDAAGAINQTTQERLECKKSTLQLSE